jgi:hypothetical protein
MENDTVYRLSVVQYLFCVFVVPETDMRDSPWQEKSPPTSVDALGTTATGWSLPYILRTVSLYAASEREAVK